MFREHQGFLTTVSLGLLLLAGAGIAGPLPPAADPGTTEAQPGCATLEVWGDLQKALSKAGNRSPYRIVNSIHSVYPDESHKLIPAAEAARMSQPLDQLGQGEGLSIVRASCLLNVPRDGYYLLSLEGNGRHQVLLSDDATPDRLRTLWTSGFIPKDIPPVFDPNRICTEGPWQYFQHDQPRYVEIRHLHRLGPIPLKLLWTLPDGTRQPIPAFC